MKERPKISIIVPVHNAGDYLKGCLDSLLNQTLREIEIIVVLDCPTDGSDLLATAYADKDSRIKLIRNSSNLHVGLSRNQGLIHVEGEYTGFFDHDDYCRPEMYELLYEHAKKSGLDMVRCNCTCLSGQKEIEYRYPDLPGEHLKQGTIEGIIENKIAYYIWNHIFKSELIREHRITFTDTKKTKSEDGLFLVQTLLCAHTYDTIPQNLYFHRWHAESTGSKQSYHALGNTVSYLEHLKLLLERYDNYPSLRLFYLKGSARELYTSFRRGLFRIPLKQIIPDIRKIKRSKTTKETIDQLFFRKNCAALFELKPTIILFLIIAKLI